MECVVSTLPVVLLVLVVVARPPLEPRGACPECPPSSDCSFSHVAADDSCVYSVDGADNNLQYKLGREFRVKCPPGVRLESPSLPRFDAELEVWAAVVECPLPAGPVARALARLNVRVTSRVELHAPPAPLRPDLFAGLERLTELHLGPVPVLAGTTPDYFTSVDAALLNSLQKLSILTLNGIDEPIRLVENLTNLNTLVIKNSGEKEIRLNSQLCDLQNLTIENNNLKYIDQDPYVPCNIANVTLFARKLRRLPLFPAAKYLNLWTILEKFKECNNLEELIVRNRREKYLGAGWGWLEECSRLRRLTLRLTRLEQLPAEPLPLDRLEQLSLTGSQLQQLPPRLFTRTTALTVLDLSGNKLAHLPLDVLNPLGRLETLNVSGNQLGSSSVAALAAPRRLRRLILSDNPLGDLCAPPSTILSGEELSGLHVLKELEQLSLSNSGASRICVDWRRDMRTLRTLHLEHNNITTIQWMDLQNWNREIKVTLTGNDISSIAVSESDYNDITDSNVNAPKVDFIMEPMRCDCSMYWLGRAIKEKKIPVSFKDLSCLTGKGSAVIAPFSYLTEHPDLMTCSERAGCPAGCRCVWYPGNDTTEVECSSRGLGAPPAVGELRGRRLLLGLRNNSIGSVPAEWARSLGARVTRLDLRHNHIADISHAALAELLAHGRRLALAGNKLGCSCPLLLALQAHADQIEDLSALHCADSRWVTSALVGCSPGEAGPAAAAGAGAALLCAAALLALRRRLQLRLKAFLLARGLCLRWLLPDDKDDCQYDVFVSYAHEDAQTALELVAGLERGGARVCVHHRDWQPGEWIPAQIRRSVWRSRRTLVLLSEHFARSSWARAEFREAYARVVRDGGARLIVVLLGEAPPARLDPDIDHFVRNNTYVRWGEPAFWDKLRLALPPPRPRPDHPRPRASPAPAPATAPPSPLAPVLKFAHITFPPPVKPAKNVSPACA